MVTVDESTDGAKHRAILRVTSVWLKTGVRVLVSSRVKTTNIKPDTQIGLENHSQYKTTVVFSHVFPHGCAHIRHKKNNYLDFMQNIMNGRKLT